MGKNNPNRIWLSLFAWIALASLFFAMHRFGVRSPMLASGLSLLQLIALIAAMLALSDLTVLAAIWRLARRKKPLVEGMMVGRLYRLVAALGIALGVAYGFGQLSSVGSFLTLFGGMLLGWSLQAPVSGFAAWVLLSAKRPIRPGDRVQFPNLGLVVDVHEVGVMYTVLNQVGGTIGSEEAVGRYILVPNAMLFSQVVINYTVTQEAPFMLDELVVRITYDSNWDVAERILLDAATEITADVVEATGAKPYIRSDFYDYGVYLRLRYNCRVQERAETAYKLSKRIYRDIQHTSSVDLAIPYIYSYRAGADKKEEGSSKLGAAENIQDIEISRIHVPPRLVDSEDVEQLAQSIAQLGLLQPILVVQDPGGEYNVVAGQLRLQACIHLGWKTIRAVIQKRETISS